MIDVGGPILLVSRLGEGGMAEVFKAVKKGPNGWEKPIALKRILPQFSDQHEFVRMLIDEAKLHAHLNHPNIVQVLDFIERGNEHMIALEYVAGKNLKTLIYDANKKKQSISREMAIYIVSEALKGLEYAHRCKGKDGPLHLIHRDISPQNILVSYQGFVKISDFGIAKANTTLEKTASNVLKGKRKYLSPEQLEGKPIDFRSDLFSTGVVLYELLAGYHPFKAASEFEMMQKITHNSFAPMDVKKMNVQQGLVDLVHRTLSTTPDLRPTSAAQFREELLAFQTPEWNTRGSDLLSRWMEGLYPHAQRTEEKGIEKTPILMTPSIPSFTVKREAMRPPRRSYILGLGGAATLLLTSHLFTPGQTPTSLRREAPRLASVASAPMIEVPAANFDSIEKPVVDHSLAVKKGKLLVTGPEGATLYLNGRQIGDLPTNVIDSLRPGAYLVSIRTALGEAQHSRVAIESGKLTRVRFHRPRL